MVASNGQRYSSRRPVGAVQDDVTFHVPVSTYNSDAFNPVVTSLLGLSYIQYIFVPEV
jgi:hypothetical protein